MSTTASGYVVDVTDDGVAIIPAPPSPQDTDGGYTSTIATADTSLPSRDSVSAAIALVRAKQMAKSAILRAEEQILQPRSVSSDQTSASVATESSLKEKVAVVNEMVESENAVPIIAMNRDKPVSISKVQTESLNSIDSQRTTYSTPTVNNNTNSSCSELPKGPSFEQIADEHSTTLQSSTDAIPDPPSFATDESNGSGDFDETVDVRTIDDVNAFLSKLGVGALGCLSNESSNSIGRLRMLSSKSSGGDSDGMESDQPESLTDVSVHIDTAVRRDGVEDEGQQEKEVRVQDTKVSNRSTKEQETGAQEGKNEVQAANAYVAQSLKADPPGPADTNTAYEIVEENPFVDNSYVADVRKVLSTVEEMASMETEEGDGANVDDDKYNDETVNCDDIPSSSKQDNVSVLHTSTLSTVVSEEHESVYGNDGRKEPNGIYEKAKVEVEKIPLSDIGVEQAIKNDMSFISTDSERYASHSKNEASETVETNDSTSSSGSRGFCDNGSLPWALRDVASEETMRATGRTRPQFVVSGPRPSSKSRNAVSLFDDISQQASETASELRPDVSFGSENSSDESNPGKNKAIEMETLDNITKESMDLCDSSVDERGEVATTDDQRTLSDAAAVAMLKVEEETVGVNSEETDDLRIQNDPSGEAVTLEVGQGATSSSSEVEVANLAEGEGERKKSISSNSTDGVPSYSFLRQFEDLDLKDENGTDNGAQLCHDQMMKLGDAPEENSIDVSSPKMLADYFLNVDKRDLEGDNEEKLANDFKKRIIPVINGNEPTIIEQAQIRQSALKANVPLNYVDAYIEYVKDQKPLVTPQVSKEDERDLHLKGEDLDEDDAVAAFLSCTKFVAQNAENKGIINDEDNEEEAEGSESLQEKRTVESISSDSHEDEHSQTSEPDFILANRGSEPEEEIKEENNRIGHSEVYDSENEEDGDDNKFRVNTSNDSENLKEAVNTRTESTTFLPRLVETDSMEKNDVETMEKNDPMDMEMLEACKSIEGFDEGIWQRRTAMATYGWGWEEATWLSSKTTPRAANVPRSDILGLNKPKDLSNLMFNKKLFPLSRKNCKNSYDRRVKRHTGYIDVDMYSLQESAVFGQENCYRDETPWELRQVRQRFLHERSLSFSRNWFGDLLKTRGNDKIKAPICQPKSMEMPMRKIPDPGDWTPEWYTTWGGQKLLLRKPSTDESSVDSCCSDSYTEKSYYGKDSLHSYTSGSSYDDDEDWEDAPECGTFVNTKQKIGEHVSRVHPDYTSSLRKSRWRKKYFPIGTFPY